MEKSTNYNFNLPNSANDEIADINDISDNFRIIDEKLKIDQIFSETSENPQSGKAIAGEIGKKQDYFADISDSLQNRDINLTDKNGTVVGQIVVVPTEGIRYTNVLTPENDTHGVNKKYVDDNFQSKLVSGTNIKTINNQSILGSGNINISGGGGTISIDSALSETSENPVQNKVITANLNNKQNKFATVTHDGSTQTVKIDGTLAITTNPNFAADQIISTKALFLSGSSTAGVRLDKTVLGNSADFDATQGYLRVRDNPLADDFAVNKKYVNDIKTELLNAITHPYTYDETTKELTLIL